MDEKTIEEKQFFEEVEEDLKYKRMYALWLAYGKYLVFGLGTALTLSVAHLLWVDYKNANAQTLTGHYMESVRSIENGDHERALSQLDYLEGKADSGFKTLVRLQKAYTLELIYDKTTDKQDELKEKIYNAYNSIQKDSRTPAFYKDMASIIIAHGPFPQQHKPEIMDRLEALSNSNTKWHHLALEALMVQHGIDRNLGKMREIATRLKDDMAISKDIKARAIAVLENLDANEMKKTKQAPAAAVATSPKGKEKK